MSKELPQKILNYFATFTETRFNFRRTIEYQWKNNETTLDFSVFPEFQELLTEKVKTGDFSSITIHPDQYTVKLPGEKVLAYLQKSIKESLSEDYLYVCIKQETDKISDSTVMVADSENGTSVKKKSDVSELTAAQEKTIWKSGTTKYNLVIQNELQNIIIHLQDELKEFLAKEFSNQKFPPSIFGPRSYVNHHFEELQKIASSNKDLGSYHKAVNKYLEKSIDDIVIYDLYHNLNGYQGYISMGTPYIFFHSIGNDSKSFPLYFAEIEVNTGIDVIKINFPRDLLFLNVPSVNSFRFENILTTPRSVSSNKANVHLAGLERFFQVEYKYQNPFISETNFSKLLHENEEYPVVEARIGLQIQSNEDRTLLDYSELLARLELNKPSQFTDVVDDYVSGRVSNFQAEVDKEFQDQYPRKSIKRYTSDSPIPLNSTQKRILLSLQNPKNKVIVVDGPPGTGKSHTIAALTYYANEANKSVVITSYKQAALDVIDNMLTKKFNDIHPTAKPSIIRISNNTDSINTIQNTLQSAVVSAATERVIDFNEEAVLKDSQTIQEKIEKIITKRLQTTSDIQKDQHDVEEFYKTELELSSNKDLSDVLERTPKYDKEVKIDLLLSAINTGAFDGLQSVSIDEYIFITEHKDRLGDFLTACEKLNDAPEGALDFKTDLDQISKEFKKPVEQLSDKLSKTVPIVKLSKKDNTGGLLSKKMSDDEIKEHVKTIKSLQFKGILSEISKLQKKELDALTLEDITNAVSILQSVIANRDYQSMIDEFKKLSNKEDLTIGEIYELLQNYSKKIDSFREDYAENLKSLFEGYKEVLNFLDINEKSLSSIKHLNDSKNENIIKWIQLHNKLSSSYSSEPFPINEVRESNTQKHKILEHKNDLRLQELAKKQGHLKQILTSFEVGKRFTREQTDILMSGISCVIADPKTISKHLPMDEDMIDILIIDEASQVSIADSISLMLRAKQVVILGDEYQYGAVSAINVNKTYSQRYFHEIIQAYVSDSGVQIQEEEEEKLLGEIGENVSEDDLMSSEVYKPSEMPSGKIDWLKTFDIRTSTLAFAKAIANYSTSLKDHYRSFPEIISYSNDFFYKPAQIELIVNRIRTKPITEVLQFLNVKTKGRTADNTNVDEIEAIIEDIKNRLENGYSGSIGVITSFKEQQVRIEKMFAEKLDMSVLKEKHNLAIWFVGDVQGEERDIIYYSFVEDKELNNSSLATIYPVIGGTADNVRSLKMQRLNVGFSRAKDTMIFVHSQPIGKYSDTRLGDALKHYQKALEESKENDMFVSDLEVFDSPQEEKLYLLLTQTEFVNKHKKNIKIIPQFPISEYLRSEYRAQIPKYRVDFLVVYSEGGKEKSLVLEYDGLEFHFKNPNARFENSLEFTDYDTQRQLELESYGYSFLRINKFTLRPENPGDTPSIVLDRLLAKHFNLHA